MNCTGEQNADIQHILAFILLSVPDPYHSFLGLCLDHYLGWYLETSKHKQKNSKSPFYSNSIYSPIQPSLPSCSSQADLLSQSPLVAVSDFSPLLKVLPLPLSPLDLQIALGWSFLRTSSPSPHELLPSLSFPSECTGIFAHLFFPSISDEE